MSAWSWARPSPAATSMAPTSFAIQRRRVGFVIESRTPHIRSRRLPESFRTYDLRHTHASLLIEQGANPLEIAQRMGHTDASITLRVYGHIFEGAQRRLTATLDQL